MTVGSDAPFRGRAGRRARDFRLLGAPAAESADAAWRASACCSTDEGFTGAPARTTRTTPPSSTIMATNASALCSEGVPMAPKMPSATPGSSPNRRRSAHSRVRRPRCQLGMEAERRRATAGAGHRRSGNGRRIAPAMANRTIASTISRKWPMRFIRGDGTGEPRPMRRRGRRRTPTSDASRLHFMTIDELG
jgi:hypothetical protein